MAGSGSGDQPARVLRRHGLRPRKRLGQNFLRDARFLDRILDAGDIGPRDEVLEVGAGTGVLTRRLGERAGRVVAVELDDDLYRLLRQELPAVPGLEILHLNALDLDPCAHFPGPYKLVANIPYYITGPILRHFLEAECSPTLLVLLLQREVAERLVAAPGDLSLLGVSVQYYGRPEIVTRVPAGAFFPPPRVDSAIVRITPHGKRYPPEHTRSFFEVARAGFGTRRKQLGNALAMGLGVSRQSARELLGGAGIEETRRAETLSLAEWHDLARSWGEAHRGGGG